MATQLINDMTGLWRAERYTDNFSAAIKNLVNKKLKAGDIEKVTPLEEAASEGGL